jgi:hypothetical protein
MVFLLQFIHGGIGVEFYAGLVAHKETATDGAEEGDQLGVALDGLGGFFRHRHVVDAIHDVIRIRVGQISRQTAVRLAVQQRVREQDPRHADRSSWGR